MNSLTYQDLLFIYDELINRHDDATIQLAKLMEAQRVKELSQVKMNKLNDYKKEIVRIDRTLDKIRTIMHLMKHTDIMTVTVDKAS
jgi:hypothetical protein